MIMKTIQPELTLIAQYDGDEWEILEQYGDQDFIEYSLENGIGTLFELIDDPVSDLDNFRMAVFSTYPRVPGMLVFARLQGEDRTSHGPEGTEYDYGWVPLVWQVVYPPGARENNAVLWCNIVISRGGFCEKCHVTLKGCTWYAKKFGLCDRCAKTLWNRDIHLAVDPLWALRQSARWSYQRCFDRRVSAEWEQTIDQANKAQLNDLIREWDASFQRSIDMWQAYQ